MSIAPIPSVPSFAIGAGFGAPGVYGLMPTATGAVGELAPSSAPSFGSMLADKIGELDALHKTSDVMAVKAVTGDLTDIHDYTIAANEAAVATQLTVAVRNKAVEAFTEIMRMQM